MRAYLDHNATSPVRPQARDAMMAGVFARLLSITGARAVDVYATSGLDRGATIYRAGWQAS